MIKQTIYIQQAVYLSVKNEQLQIHIKNNDEEKIESRPIEDIGMIILDNEQIKMSHYLLSFLASKNVALVSCDEKHLPIGLLMPLEGHTLQSQRFRAQIGASQALNKNLWQQTISAKITNQAAVLKQQNISQENMTRWAGLVKSGDTENLEARAAAYYWKNIFIEYENFTRNREGIFPNHLLNYGYAILRATVARALVGSGLLPTLGIHHKNKYNAYCLADDIMEPYRPFVDKLVLYILDNKIDAYENETISKEQKKILLQINATDIIIQNEKSPLMVGLQRTTASLVACYEGKAKKILYPIIS